jgi:deazaflavin-dependent oxidoreductase (nitroreductase family)
MSPMVRRIFWFFNTFFMTPMFRLGFGALMGNPLTGYIMVLKVIGRKSGKVRYAPVNFALRNGNVYCISGGRQTADWYRNLKANPQLELILPAGAIFGCAEEVSDKDERHLVIRPILQNAGFAGFMEGYNPFTIRDEDLFSKTADLPVLRIRPLGIGSGAFDAGGWSWIWWPILFAIAIIWVLLR